MIHAVAKRREQPKRRTANPQEMKRFMRGLGAVRYGASLN